MVNNTYHIIGGSDINQHLLFDEEINKLKVLHELNEDEIMPNPLQNHRIIRVKDKLLMIGGFDASPMVTVDRICEYDIKNNKWNLMETKMPKPLSSFGCTSIFSDEYVLLFGGSGNDRDLYDDIWIYSVSDKKFTKSVVKCPMEGYFQAITLNNREKDEVVVFGFVRITLIQIIFQYYFNEYVHLFDTDAGKHWRINAFDIMR